MGRLTDEDKALGKYIVYGKTNGWAPYRMVFSTGPTESAREPTAVRNELTVYAWGWVARIRLPFLKVKHHAIQQKAYWEAETIRQMGRDWYWKIHPRDYGFSYDKGFLTVYYGPQTMDSTDTKSWSHSFGWTGSHQKRHSMYDDQGKLFFEQRGNKQPFEEWWAKKKEVPLKGFLLKDYDGEEIQANTYIEEREWSKGDKWFAWLSWFTKNQVRRTLQIDFDKETGPEKGSWKGGTCGTSIDLLPGELHESAMRRFCQQEHRSKYKNFVMLFIGPLDNPFPERPKPAPEPADPNIGTAEVPKAKGAK